MAHVVQLDRMFEEVTFHKLGREIAAKADSRVNRNALPSLVNESVFAGRPWERKETILFHLVAQNFLC